MVSFTSFFPPFVCSLLFVRSLWLCLMWVLLLGLFDLLCRSLWFSYFFYFFLFFKVALVDVGLCQWWLVGVVATVVIGACCCDSGGCAVVVDGDEREEIIYYFNT